MTDRLRREARRQPADWLGLYQFDNLEKEPWRCCRVVDISPLGAGLELLTTSPDEYLDGPITVCIELRGSPRNVVRDDDKATARVGIEFTSPTDAAKEYLRSINGVHPRW